MRSAAVLFVGILLAGDQSVARPRGQAPEITPPQFSADAIQVNKERMESVEDLTESFANALLELSVATRRRDMERIKVFLADDLEAEALPCQAGPPKREVRWIQSHTWSVEPSAAPAAGKSEILSQLGAFLQHFSDIEDVRFKVKEAKFEDPAVPRGDARIFFYVVGRDMEGRREWVRGTFYMTGVQTADKKEWRIVKWRTASLSSDVADVDLFTEIGAPAGIARIIPAFGVPPNDGFVAQGGAAADVDADGLVDLFVTEIDGNRLFLNDGKGGFRDVSEETLVRLTPRGTAPLFLDFDNDGDLDVFLSAVGNQVLLDNRLRPEGKLKFQDISEEAGVSVPAVGFSAAAADVNGDKLPDIYVASYNRYGTVMPNSWSRATNGTPNLFFISQGKGKYRESAHAWGVDDSRWSYAAAFADVDSDGRLDLFVANDFGEKALFMNKGGRFVDEAAMRGVLDPGNGMGVSFGDFDNDGDLDLHVTNMSSTAGNRILQRLMPDAKPGTNVLKKLAAGNSLYENIGGGYFRDASERAGNFSAGWAYGGGFFDFDNDGWEDEFSVNGFVSGSTMNDT